MHDLRLIRTWQSDAGKASREIAARRDIPAFEKIGSEQEFVEAQ